MINIAGFFLWPFWCFVSIKMLMLRERNSSLSYFFPCTSSWEVCNFILKSSLTLLHIRWNCILKTKTKHLCHYTQCWPGKKPHKLLFLLFILRKFITSNFHLEFVLEICQHLWIILSKWHTLKFGCTFFFNEKIKILYVLKQQVAIVMCLTILEIGIVMMKTTTRNAILMEETVV